MKVLKADERLYMVRVDRGEEIVESLHRLAREIGIPSAVVTGIGGVSEARLGYLDTVRKEYLARDFDEDLELISLTGNLSVCDGEPLLHAHVVLADADFRCYAGHLVRAVVGVTGEFAVRVGDEALLRQQNDALGIKEQQIPNPLRFAAEE